MTISFTSNGTTSQILHNGAVVHNINAGGLQNLAVANLATEAKPLGAEQTWQNVTASRAHNTTYTNSTGRPIQVSITVAGSTGNTSLVVGGVTVATVVDPSGTVDPQLTAIIPAGATYGTTGAGNAIVVWSELR